MTYQFEWLPFAVFLLIVLATVGLSFYLGSRAKSASGYFAAGGGIHWFVNGVAFAGDYLSAASFLGICGMIAFYGYDGFLYSIGYLAGWVVALFVVAEPMKRMGKYTFADALDSRFQSRGIQLAAGLSTLAVSLFYLIPQMVGAGALVKPLLGLPQWVGVAMVGAVVILIVTTAGMVSTTYVQFLKGALLVIFSFVLTVLILQRGLVVAAGSSDGKPLQIPQQVTEIPGKGKWINGLPQGRGPDQADLLPVGQIASLPSGVQQTGPLGPIEYLKRIQESQIVLWAPTVGKDPQGNKTTTYAPRTVSGSELMRPGNLPAFAGIRDTSSWGRWNFLSLMLALFCGTASLPHILIRYYTVRD
ncbi:MAG: sodium:solute symporter family transporter, partial [Pirellulaceae bacterium]